jgi:membrane protease YdiL (CAAX protease family)
MGLATTRSRAVWLAAYVAAFFCLWWFAVLLYLEIRPHPSSLDVAAFFALKCLIWIVPTIFYIVKLIHDEPLRFLKLTTSLRQGLLWSAGLIMVLAPAWIYAVAYLRGRPVDFAAWWSPGVLWDAFIASALIEEIAMRGFVLGALRQITGFWSANLLTAVLFVAFHWQHWLFLDPQPLLHVAAMSASLLLLSLCSGYLVKRSGSIWPSVVLHGLQNLVALI